MTTLSSRQKGPFIVKALELLRDIHPLFNGRRIVQITIEPPNVEVTFIDGTQQIVILWDDRDI